MEVEILTENIEQHLPTLTRLLPSHSQVPILNNLVLEANKEGFFIKATDLELGVIIKIPAKINTTGSVSVPGKQFIETVTNLPKDKMTLVLDNETLKLTIRDNKVNFQTLSALEFPELIKEKGEIIVTLKKTEFDKLFDHLAFSASSDDVRPHLTGIYIAKKDNSVELVTTDGYRLTVKTIQSLIISKIKEPIIISTRVIGEAMGIRSNEISIFVNNDENQVVFEGGDVTLIGRLIEGKFPPYEKVIPSDSKTKVTVNREDFIQEVRLASVFAKEVSNIVTLTVAGSEIKLSARSAGVGEGEFVVECEKTGDDNSIAFNIRYLSDILKNLEGESVIMEINGPVSPALFTDNKNTLKHVIMPIKTD